MVYYIETNIIAIIVASIMIIQNRRITSKKETSNLFMAALLRLLVLLCVSDIFAYIFRGKNLFGVFASNTVYFAVMALGTFVWFLFILVKTHSVKMLTKTTIITGIPLFVLFIGILTNYFHNFFFTVDAELLYHRGAGIYFVWIIEWAYMIAAIVVNVIAVKKEKRSFVKNEYRGYIFFFIPMFIAAASQMIFYGTTTIQIGFMVGLLLAFLNRQHYQVQKDALTGISNRNAFLTARDTLTGKPKPTHITVFMIDVDKFKTINDYYGHLKGDQALCDVACVLKESIKENKSHDLELYRFAGDEFVIIGTEINSHIPDLLISKINENLEKQNQINHENGEKYHLSLSIGYESGFCDKTDDFDKITNTADEKMYEIKSAKYI